MKQGAMWLLLPVMYIYFPFSKLLLGYDFAGDDEDFPADLTFDFFVHPNAVGVISAMRTKYSASAEYFCLCQMTLVFLFRNSLAILRIHLLAPFPP
jgi:hypothetical protein